MDSANPIQIYEAEDGRTRIDVRFEQNTIWLSQAQMAELFVKDVRTINEHVGNVYKEGELTQSKATIRKFRIVRQEGSRQVRREIDYYNLDMVISVGYRISSKKGTQFRIWATQRLKEYLVHGYTLNQQRFDQNAKELQQALALIRKAAKSPEITAETGSGFVEIVSRYTQTFLWLQRYDEGSLDEPSGQAGGSLPSPDDAMQSLTELKQSLIERGEATELFANPRDDCLAGIFGNLDQTVFGKSAYPSIESKAAHLLYFIVKDHPFSDGNKRSGAFLFVDFLNRNGRLFDEQGDTVINDTGLAALTLLVAESDPKQKDTLIRLIMHMLVSGAAEKSARFICC